VRGPDFMVDGDKPGLGNQSNRTAWARTTAFPALAQQHVCRTKAEKGLSRRPLRPARATEQLAAEAKAGGARPAGKLFT